MATVALKEAKKLLSFWGKGTFPTVSESIPKRNWFAKNLKAKSLILLNYLNYIFANQFLKGISSIILQDTDVKFPPAGLSYKKYVLPSKPLNHCCFPIHNYFFQKSSTFILRVFVEP